MKLSFLARSAITAIIVSTSAAAAPQSTPSSTTACNNSPSLCGKHYNNITYIGAHDAAFLRDDSTSNSISGNQFKNATLALDAGLRMLQAQVHKVNGVLRLCHTTCDLLDAGPLQNWLSKIGTWMSQNPNEVVTLLLVNSDSADVTEFGPIYEGAGLVQYSYKSTSSHPTSSWPTLQSMIDQKTRLVSFVTNTKYDSSVPYMLPEFNFVFETEFEVTDLNGFNCTLDRPKSQDSANAAIASNHMGLVNHFKDKQLFGSAAVPDVDALDIVNSADTKTAGNLGLHLNTCKTQWGIQPTFVLIDFWNQGNPLAAADSLNGVSDAVGRKATASTSTSKSDAQSMQGMGKGALMAAVGAILLLV